MTWSSQPVVITVAPTGAETTRDQNPNLPITPEEIADATVQSAHEGASVVHIHARNPDGSPTTDVDTLRRIADLIRSETDIVINMSTGAEVGMSWEERARVLDATPEIASLNTGSMNFGELVFENSLPFIRHLAERMQDSAIRPELEIYDVGMLATVGRLIDEGLIDTPPLYNFVMGVPGGIDASASNLITLLNNRPLEGAWSTTGIGRHQLPLGTLSTTLGGHVRVGFEDNVYFRKGELAKSNAQLVARARRIVEMLERPLATPDVARQLLGVSHG